jgi:hypothetical protein
MESPTKRPVKAGYDSTALGYVFIQDAAGGDAAEVFDPLKEVLDQMMLAIAGLAERGRGLSIPARRHAESVPRLASHLRKASLS